MDIENKEPEIELKEDERYEIKLPTDEYRAVVIQERPYRRMLAIYDGDIEFRLNVTDMPKSVRHTEWFVERIISFWRIILI